MGENITVPVIDIDLSGVESRLDTVETTLETIETDLQTLFHHPALETPFEEYTVTEALLLLIFLSLVVKGCLGIVRRGFRWLF